MKNEPYFPLFISLKDKKILVVGGGQIASRRIAALIDFGCHITVVAPQISAELTARGQAQQVQIQLRHYRPEDLNCQDLVLAATNCPTVNNLIADNCRCQGIPVNHCADRQQCDFYFPGLIKHEQLIIGVTASGENHSLVKQVVRRIRQFLTDL